MTRCILSVHSTKICLVSALILFKVSFSYAGTIYKYDDLDRLFQVWYSNTDYIEYTYDNIGNLISKIPHGKVVTITAITTNGEKIYPSGTTTLFYGGNVTYSIVPPLGRKITGLYVDGNYVGASLGYQFANVQSNHSISATFGLGCTNPPVRILPRNVYAYTLANALASAVAGDTIQIHLNVFNEGNVAGNKSVTIDGGYDCNYLNKFGVTTIIGAVNVNDGQVIMKDIDLH